MKKKIALLIAFAVTVTMFSGCNKSTEPEVVALEMSDSYFETLVPEVQYSVQDLSKRIAAEGTNPFEGIRLMVSVPCKNYSDKWCDIGISSDLSIPVEPDDPFLAELLAKPKKNTEYYQAIKGIDILESIPDTIEIPLVEPEESNDTEAISEVNTEVDAVTEVDTVAEVDTITEITTSVAVDNETISEETTETTIEDSSEAQIVDVDTSVIDQIKSSDNGAENTFLIWCKIVSVEPISEPVKTSITGDDTVDTSLFDDESLVLIDGNTRYKVTLGDLEYVGYTSSDFTSPIEFGETSSIKTPVTEAELQSYIKVSDIIANNEAILQAEEQEKAEIKKKMDSMSTQELATYIRSMEEDLSKYELTPNSSFIIKDGKILALTDEGLARTELVIGQYSIPLESKFWEQIRNAGVLEKLIFKGNYYVETKNLLPETNSEKYWREKEGREAPYEIISTMNFVVPSGALKDLKSLKYLSLPDGIESIGQDAFAYCDNLEYVRMPQHAGRLDGGLFKNSKIENLIMPYTITNTYNTETLAYMPELVNLVFITHGQPTVGLLDDKQYIFKGCDKLERAALDKSDKLGKWTLKYSSDWFDSLKIITQ